MTLKMFSPVGMLHIGMSTNRFTTLLTCGSNTLAMMAQLLSSFRLFDSSTIKVKGWVLSSLTTGSLAWGARALFTTAVVFVLEQEKRCAILLSGNISFTSLVKWSPVANGRLCLHKNWQNKSSAFVTYKEGLHNKKYCVQAWSNY